jgi:hypothetical protein
VRLLRPICSIRYSPSSCSPLSSYRSCLLYCSSSLSRSTTLQQHTSRTHPSCNPKRLPCSRILSRSSSSRPLISWICSIHRTCRSGTSRKFHPSLRLHRSSSQLRRSSPYSLPLNQSSALVAHCRRINACLFGTTQNLSPVEVLCRPRLASAPRIYQGG